MIEILIKVFNMSISASIVALIIMLIRLPLKKAPKRFSYALWTVVFFRLICPIEFESPVSLMPTNTEGISPLIVAESMFINSNLIAPEPAITLAKGASPQTDIVASNSKNSTHFILLVCVIIWLVGLVWMMIYAVFSYIRIKCQVFDATLIRNNIFESDKIHTAFVFGFFRTKIYLPKSVSSSQNKYILEHEQVHISRRDYLIKPVAFFIVAIHWFNPIVWISYYIMSMDMEMSCDEAVLQKTNEDIRKAYSVLLVNLYTQKPELLSPLAFGEGSFNSMKVRIKNVLNFKKTPRWAIVPCFTLLMMFIVGFVTTQPKNAVTNTESFSLISGQPENTNNKLGVKSMVKDVTVEIESIVKNDNMARIHYSIQGKQDKLNTTISAITVYYMVKGYHGESTAFKKEDGKYYGTFYVFSQNGIGFEDKHTELQIVRISNQINGKSKKIDLNLFNLRAPSLMEDSLMEDIESFQVWKNQMIRSSESADYYNTFQFLQPDVYNYKLPTETDEAEVWLSNIGIINNELRIQLKTFNLNQNSKDGIFATDLPMFIQDQVEENQYLNNIQTFYMSENGQIYFLDSETTKYIITEFSFELRQHNINELELYCSPIFQSIINGTWEFSLDAEQFAETITKDLTGIQVMNKDSTGLISSYSDDMVMLKKLTVTPLYYELSFEAKDKSYRHIFYPKLVITYINGRKTEFVGFSLSYDVGNDNMGIRFAGDERTSPHELIELDKIQSITLDGIEIFNLN